MKVVLINLDKDVKRLKAANMQLRRLGVEYERIPAIYAKGLSDAEKGRHVSCFRWWCAIGRKQRDGEIGCALSHMKAWEIGLLSDDAICVLEDDVVLDSRFKEVLSKLDAQVDTSKPSLYLLSNHRLNTGLGTWHSGYLSPDDEAYSIKRADWDFYAEGYVVTRKAAEAIKNANYPIITPIDHFGRWNKLGIIELYHVFPTVCSQNKDAFKSETVVEFGPRVSEYGLAKWCVHKAKRLIGVTIDKILIWVTGR